MAWDNSNSSLWILLRSISVGPRGSPGNSVPFPYIGGSYVQPAAALRPQKKEQFTSSAVIAALQLDGQKPLIQLLVQTLSFANNYHNLVVPSLPWGKCLGKVMYFVLCSTLCKWRHVNLHLFMLTGTWHRKGNFAVPLWPRLPGLSPWFDSSQTRAHLEGMRGVPVRD